MLAAPMAEGGDDLLSEAVRAAVCQGLARPLQYVVVILSQRGALVVKVVQVDEGGTGIRLFCGRNSLGGVEGGAAAAAGADGGS